MNEHEQETRELEGQMERALAVAIAHSSTLIEAAAKIAARHRGRTPPAADASPAGELDTAAVVVSKEVQLRARTDLAAGRDDASFWRNASSWDLMETMRREHGIEPSRLGQREHDRQWAERAPGADVIGLYAMADRYAEDATYAANVRDNLGTLIAEYGLDPADMLTRSPEQAAAAYTQARAEFWAPGRDDEATMSADGRDATDRDGVTVVDLIGRAQDADAAAERDSERADETAAAADKADAGTERQVLSGTVVGADDGPTRAERVAAASSTAPGKAAATAARDHPTNPRAAAAAAHRGQPKARRGTAPAAARDRGRGL